MVSTGGPGRLLVGTTVTSQFAGDIEGNPIDWPLGGLFDTNMYLFDAPTDTPLILGLEGGSDVYGLTSLTPTDVPGLLDAVPSTATLALIRLDELPAGLVSDDSAYDAIVIANVSDTGVDFPAFGAGVTDDAMALAVRGIVNNQAFGGLFPDLLASLEPGGVWVTLVPEDTTAFALVIFTDFVSDADLADGEVIFFERACVADLDGSGDVGLADLLVVLAAWDAEGEPVADLDGDGSVGLGDLLVVLSAWGVCD
jgi:hypothetical protein